MLNKNSFQEVLSICIPTRNRAKKLIDTVWAFHSQIKSHSVRIYISDNSDDDKTMKLIEENFGLDNNSVVYMKNGAEFRTYANNILNLAFKVRGEYIWFFGDDDLPYENALDKIFSTLCKSPDFIEVKYVGYNYMLEKILPNSKIVNSNDKRVDKNYFIQEMIETFSYNGFMSFILFKRKYLLWSLNSKHIDLNSNYILTFAWYIALLSIPEIKFGISIGLPLVKWREDYGTSPKKLGLAKSRFILNLEHRNIFSILSKIYNISTLLQSYDGPFQIKIIGKAIGWRRINHLSFSDAIFAVKNNDDFKLHTKMVIILTSLFPAILLRKLTSNLTMGSFRKE